MSFIWRGVSDYLLSMSSCREWVLTPHLRFVVTYTYVGV